MLKKKKNSVNIKSKQSAFTSIKIVFTVIPIIITGFLLLKTNEHFKQTNQSTSFNKCYKSTVPVANWFKIREIPPFKTATTLTSKPAFLQLYVCSQLLLKSHIFLRKFSNQMFATDL